MAGEEKPFVLEKLPQKLWSAGGTIPYPGATFTYFHEGGRACLTNKGVEYFDTQGKGVNTAAFRQEVDGRKVAATYDVQNSYVRRSLDGYMEHALLERIATPGGMQNWLRVLDQGGKQVGRFQMAGTTWAQASPDGAYFAAWGPVDGIHWDPLPAKEAARLREEVHVYDREGKLKFSLKKDAVNYRLLDLSVDGSVLVDVTDEAGDRSVAAYSVAGERRFTQKLERGTRPLSGFFLGGQQYVVVAAPPLRPDNSYSTRVLAWSLDGALRFESTSQLLGSITPTSARTFVITDRSGEKPRFRVVDVEARKEVMSVERNCDLQWSHCVHIPEHDLLLVALRGRDHLWGWTPPQTTHVLAAYRVSSGKPAGEEIALSPSTDDRYALTRVGKDHHFLLPVNGELLLLSLPDGNQRK
jgi:hypothetical protein